MTPRQLDYLAAWWRGQGSNVKAGRILNLSPQVIRNELHRLRKEELVADNMMLVKRYAHLIEGRRLEPAVPRSARNITLRQGNLSTESTLSEDVTRA